VNARTRCRGVRRCYTRRRAISSASWWTPRRSSKLWSRREPSEIGPGCVVQPSAPVEGHDQRGRLTVLGRMPSAPPPHLAVESVQRFPFPKALVAVPTIDADCLVGLRAFPVSKDFTAAVLHVRQRRRPEEMDRRFPAFCTLFEREVVSHAEQSSLVESMEAGWQAPRGLPRGGLHHLSDREISDYLGAG